MAVVVSVLAFPSMAGAATLTVNTLADEHTASDGTCSLREAIDAINTPPGGGDCTPTGGGTNTIVLGEGRYPLTLPGASDNANAGGDLDIAGLSSSLTIAGAGPASTIIDATGLGDRVIEIRPGGPSVTMSGLTITGGRAPAGADAQTNGAFGTNGDSGGGIEAQANLTLTNVRLTDNRAGDGGDGGPASGVTGGTGALGGYGGAIDTDHALTISDSVITNNRSGNGGNGGSGISNNGGTGGGGGVGGAIYSQGGLTITNSTISGNRAGNGGRGGSASEDANGGAGGNSGDAAGGIFAVGMVVISGSTISGNVAANGGAGGDGGHSMFLGGAGGNGGAGGRGGGIGVALATVQMTNTTIASNFAGNGGAGGHGGSAFGGGGGNGGHGGNGGLGGNGGGFRGFANSTLVNVTVTDNAPGTGGALGPGGSGTIGNGTPGTAGANGSGGGVYDTVGTTIIENTIVALNGGGNCLADGSGAIADGGHDVVFGDTTCPPGAEADPKLGPLQDNGGPTQTVGLLAGSAARDLVSSVGADCPTSDQRGLARPFGAGCDAGAYESTPPVATTGAASAISAAGASLAGSVTPNSGDAAVHFDYGTTTDYGSQSADQHVGGLSATDVSATLDGLSPSTTYHYRVVATSADGTGVGADQAFMTAPVGGGGPPPGGGSTLLAAISSLKLSPTAFAAAPRGPSARAAAKRAVSTKVTYKLNEAASVRFTVVKPAPGRRVRGRCVAPTRKNRKARKCTRLVKLRGSFTRTGVAGTNRFRFTGRLRKRALKPGKYRLVATPSAGGKTGKPVSARFRIVK